MNKHPGNLNQKFLSNQYTPVFVQPVENKILRKTIKYLENGIY